MYYGTTMIFCILITMEYQILLVNINISKHHSITISVPCRHSTFLKGMLVHGIIMVNIHKTMEIPKKCPKNMGPWDTFAENKWYTQKINGAYPINDGSPYGSPTQKP